MKHKQNQIINALSFDIEDWFHLVDIKSLENPDHWPSLPSIVEHETNQILQTLDQYNTHATFFILGWIAQKYPHIPKLIADSGHELATHSFFHRRVDKLTPDQFHNDLKNSIDAIQQPTGKKILGFRAPSFSITPGSEWAFDILHQLNIKYDASLFPAPRGQGGYPCQNQPHLFTNTPSGKPIPELPMSIIKLGPLKLPFSGGGYMRLLPKPIIRAGFNQLNKKQIPVVVYLHPRDFAIDCPKAQMPLSRKFRAHVGTRSTRAKLHMILKNYPFNTCASILGLDADGNPTPDSIITQHNR